MWIIKHCALIRLKRIDPDQVQRVNLMLLQITYDCTEPIFAFSSSIRAGRARRCLCILCSILGAELLYPRAHNNLYLYEMRLK